MTVTAAVDTDPNVTGYEFWTPCGSSNMGAPGSGAQPSANFDLDPQCATTTDFMVLSVDGNGDVVHWVYAPNHAVTATIDLTAMAFTNVPSTKTYTLNNADAFGSQMQVVQSLVSQRGEAVKRFGTANGKGSPFTLTMTNPNFTNAIDLVQLSGTTTNGVGEHNLLDWGPYSTSYTVDVGARTLADLTLDPDIDTTAHQLTYTTSGGVAPEFVLAFGDASRTGLHFDWAILAPYGASVQFPTLPTDVADFTIKSDDSYGVEAMLFGKVPGGYDAVRAKLVDVMLGESGPLDLVTTATGAITIEMYQRPRVKAARTTRPTKTPGLGAGSRTPASSERRVRPQLVPVTYGPGAPPRRWHDRFVRRHRRAGHAAGDADRHGRRHATVERARVLPKAGLDADLEHDDERVGVASALMPDGGYVSAVSPFPTPPLPAGGPRGAARVAVHVRGVKPGDHLVLNDDDGRTRPRFRSRSHRMPPRGCRL